MELSKDKLKQILSNYSFLDIEFGYKHIVIKLNQGHELVISAEFDDLDNDSELSINHYVTKREFTGGTRL
ncbi:hypothetical protein ABEX38_30120 [Priestia megaterium]